MVIYISGAGRSGSTLLEGLLAESVGAAPIGEVRLFLGAAYRWKIKCECGEPFADCPFWSAVMHQVLPNSTAEQRQKLESTQRGLITNRSLHRVLRGRSSWSLPEQDVASHYDRFYRSIATIAGSNVLVDSSKSPTYAAFLHSLGSLDLRIIHLVRDSRAVTHSWQRKKEWLASASDAPFAMRTYRPARVAREWVAYNALSDGLRLRVKPSILVRYEDLADNSHKVIDQIIDSIGIPKQPKNSAAQFGHGFLGNPIRFADGPVEVRRDDEWQRQLSDRDRRLATALTLPQLLRYGYRP